MACLFVPHISSIGQADAGSNYIPDLTVGDFCCVLKWCVYCTKLEPIFKTNDVARAERVVALN